MKSCEILRRYYRKTIDIKCLADWASGLLREGHESDDLYLLMSIPDIHWSELPRYVESVCQDLGICEDFSDPYKAYKNVSLEAYRKGELSGPELLFYFDDIRKKVAFPETLTWRIMEVDAGGSNPSGLHSDMTKKTGKALETYVDEYITRSRLFMTLIEKLIVEPSKETTDLLFDDHSEVFWVDWREDDGAIAGFCDAVIESKQLSSLWKGDKLFVHCGDVLKKVPLTNSCEDRHVTILTINKVISPDYEIRMVWDSHGSDTLAFAVLKCEAWASLEARYGEHEVDRAFFKLTDHPNTFTDSLDGFRPPKREKGWRFW